MPKYKLNVALRNRYARHMEKDLCSEIVDFPNTIGVTNDSRRMSIGKNENKINLDIAFLDDNFSEGYTEIKAFYNKDTNDEKEFEEEAEKIKSLLEELASK